MAGGLDYAKEWMRNGDRLLARASERLAAFESDADRLHVDMAVHEFSRAAQMYLTGAVEYQRGRDTTVLATSSLDETVRLVQHLEGRLRSEAEAAWQTAKPHLLPSEESNRASGLDAARAFAESLRERLAYAVPELFDRGPSGDPGRDPRLPRSR